MSITKEQIIQRRAQLVDERQRVLDNANAFNGAIQECDRLLVILDTPVVDEVEPLKVVTEVE